MKANPTNAIKLRTAWNHLLLSSCVEVCTAKLKGCNVTEVKILKMLYENPNLQIKQLLSTLKIPNSTLTNTINRLTGKELVLRKLNEEDLRSFELELTPTGKIAVEEHLAAEVQVFDNLLSVLSPEEASTFVALFEKVATQ